MGLNELQKLKGAAELMELAMIPDMEDRLKAIDGWLKRRVRDYHVDIINSKLVQKHIGLSGYKEQLEHQKRSAAFQIGEALLKDKMILCEQIFPDPDERNKYQRGHHWSDVEERYRLDCYVYFGLY